MILAVFAARRMTLALSRLSFATTKISQGDFNVRVEVSGGEIGVLAESFNTMASEVSRLMLETAEKARMESELATARAVQETLFPESAANLGSVEIAGHYAPASECGGDWWHYCENGDKVYIWVGDATGHGVPAALLTSAARAVTSVITLGPPRPVSECLSILNHAICETSKGKMMMTFFLACIDKRTGEMNYANASHEPPMILHKMSEEPTRNDFTPLNEINNPRLGEQPDIGFRETKVWLEPGDCVVFYTDGLTDVKNKESKAWGERRFLKALASEIHAKVHKGDASSNDSLKMALNGVVADVESFREQTQLDDDVTLILCRFNPNWTARQQGAA
jgi:sigma-B regulation protein RsbU (phosphoserine phosphatase)